MREKANLKHSFRQLPSVPAGILESLESRVLFSAAALAIVPQADNQALPAVSSVPASSTGTGLEGEYFIGNDFETPVAVSTAPKINFKWDYGRPLAVVPAGAFSVKWTGTLTPVKSDTYTFYTSADSGTNVLINGEAVISNLSSRSPGLVSGSVALTAGVPVSIEVDYTSRDAHVPARMALLWSSSTFSKRLVPRSVLTPATVGLPAEPLTASYYLGEDFNKLVLTEAESAVHFNLKPTVPDALIPDGDSFSVNWTGDIIAPYTGNYVFKTITDDGVRLYVNGSLIINHWQDESHTTYYKSVALTAGQSYSITMQYYDNGIGAGIAKLLWHEPVANATGYLPFSLTSTVQPLTPAAPTDVTATPFSQSQVDLSWTDVANETGFIVERSSDGGTTFTQIGTTAQGVTTFDDTGLTAGTSYVYEVIATNAAGDSPSSAAVPASPLPTLPTAVVASASLTNGNSATITWTAAATATSYVVQESPDGTTGWTQAATTSATSAVLTGLTNSTTYYYRVYGTNTAGSGGPSNVVSITTVPAAPTNLTAAVGSASEIDLTWNDVTGETGFLVQQSADGTTGWTQIASVGSGTTAFSAGGLSAATTYYFRVLANGAGGLSNPSNVANATTSAANPTYASLTTLYGLSGTGKVYSLDTTTGAATQIGTLAFGTDAAGRDPLSGNFFYVSTGSSTIEVAEWNPNDGSNTIINASVPVGGGVAQAAFRDDGQLFITDDVGDVYSIDSTTGDATLKGVIHYNGSVLDTGNGDIAFAPDGTMYMDYNSNLYSIPSSEIDAGTGSGSAIDATLIGANGGAGLQIAFGQNGILYGDTNTTGQLFTVSTSTGAETAVGSPSGVAMNDLASIPLYGELTVAQSASTFVRNTAGGYTITVSNGGPDTTVGPITLVDTLDAGVTFASGSGTGWTFSVSGSTVTMTYIPNVAAGSSAPAVTLNVNIASSAASSVTNTVLASTTEFETNTANNTNSISTGVTG